VERIERLLLASGHARGDLAECQAPPHVIDTLLAGLTLRGATDDGLAAVTGSVGVLPSVPENRYHRRHTVDALLTAITPAAELRGSPDPPQRQLPAVRRVLRPYGRRLRRGTLKPLLGTIVRNPGDPSAGRSAPEPPGTDRTFGYLL
jgi:hypothetical protein